MVKAKEKEKEIKIAKTPEGAFFNHSNKIRETIGSLKLELYHNDITEEIALKNWHSNWHFHSLIEIIIMRKGNTVISTDAANYRIKAGDVAIIPAKLNHKSFSDESGQERFSFFFNLSSRQSDIVPQNTESKLRSFFEIVNESEVPLLLPKDEKVILDLECMLDRARQSGAMTKSVLKYYLLALMLDLVEGFLSQEVSEIYSHKIDGEEEIYQTSEIRNRMIEQYFYENDCKNVSIKGLAKHIHLSERQTSRILSESFGATFKQIVNQTRIRIAQSYLLSGMGLGETSESVGFQSINGFNKAFKSVAGITPFQFTKEHKEEIWRNLAKRRNEEKQDNLDT